MKFDFFQLDIRHMICSPDFFLNPKFCHCTVVQKFRLENVRVKVGKTRSNKSSEQLEVSLESIGVRSIRVS